MTATSREQEGATDAFIHVADLHFWKVTANPLRLLNKRVLGNLNVWLKRRHHFPFEEAAHYAGALEATGLREAVLTGDFASTSLDEEFALARRFVDALRDRGFTLRLIPGNHDVYTFESRRKGRFERHFEAYLRGEVLPSLHHLSGGTPLLLVPTVCPNLVSSRGRITPAEVARTRELLGDTPEVVVVAGHYPILDRTEAYELTRERRLRNARALREALGRSGRTILYVAGHVHRFSYVGDPEFPGLSHLCTGAFFVRNRREGLRGEFSVVRVKAHGFEVERHVLRETWEQRRVPVSPA